MVIDFHTHIFPEEIAGRTIEKLSSVANLTPYTNGTLQGLKKSMKENGITISVIQPVMTKPSQFDTMNTFAAEITGKDGILSFGGIHPDTNEVEEKLLKIRDMGLRGIKLHPDYQKTYVDDPKMVRIIRVAAELGLVVMLHAGIDIGLPDPVHCTPSRTANMLAQIDCIEPKIVLAHTGGYGMWDEVEEYLVGKNVWMDISYSMGVISEEQLIRIVKNHGVDRFLFASDSPWGSQGKTLKYFMGLDFTKEEQKRILYQNAMELLELEYADHAISMAEQ